MKDACVLALSLTNSRVAFPTPLFELRSLVLSTNLRNTSPVLRQSMLKVFYLYKSVSLSAPAFCCFFLLNIYDVGRRLRTKEEILNKFVSNANLACRIVFFMMMKFQGVSRLTKKLHCQCICILMWFSSKYFLFKQGYLKLGDTLCARSDRLGRCLILMSSTKSNCKILVDKNILLFVKLKPLDSI